MTVRLNGGLLRSLIDAAGGIEAFLDRWHVLSADGLDHLNKGTVYRWISGQLPKDSKRLLRLSAVLDVDPFALLSVDDSGAADAADEILEIVQANRSVPAALQLLRPFFGRRVHWPPEIPGCDGQPRLWHVREFEHDPSIRSNFYQIIELSSNLPEGLSVPQVFHFGFRHPQMFAARWLQYGFVQRRGLRAALWHVNGYAEELTLHTLTEPTLVQTWFGPGPATFRVASLHSFALGAFGRPGDDRPVLTFPG